MSRDNWAKWTLPDDVHPATSTSWCVPVPDDPFYRAAFLGALQNLGSAYKWADDPDHTAKDVAMVWRNIIDDLKKCHDEPTTKFVVIPVEDFMSVCQQLRFHDGKLQGLCGMDCDTNEPLWVDICGQDDIPSGSQPSSGSRPAAGASKCFTKSMTARDVFLIPFGVQAGDTVTVTELSGAWSDDGLLWTCTDGTPFALGECSGSRYHSGSDPDATLYHGQLMLVVAGQYLSATDGAVVLSGFTGQQQLTVMPNFEPGLFAGGTVTYKICVQNGGTPPGSTYCYDLNLALSESGGVPFTDQGEWVPGEGFKNPGSGPTPTNCEIHWTPTGTVGATSITYTFNVLVAATSGPSCAIYTSDGLAIRDNSLVETTGIKTITYTGDLSGLTDIFFTSAGDDIDIRLIGATFAGPGDAWNGASNC